MEANFAPKQETEMCNKSVSAQIEALKARSVGMQAAMREIQISTAQMKSKMDMSATADALSSVKEAMGNYTPHHEFQELERQILENYQRTEKAAE